MSIIARITELVAEGNWGTVRCVVLQNGEIPAKEFLENECEAIREKGKNDPQSTAHARFLLLFQVMAEYGWVAPKRFKKEMGALYAFKHEVKNIQIRFPCFQDGNHWLLTHGFIKPGAQRGKGKWPESEVRRANQIEAEYYQRKKQLEDASKRRSQ